MSLGLEIEWLERPMDCKDEEIWRSFVRKEPWIAVVGCRRTVEEHMTRKAPPSCPLLTFHPHWRKMSNLNPTAFSQVQVFCVAYSDSGEQFHPSSQAHGPFGLIHIRTRDKY